MKKFMSLVMSLSVISVLLTGCRETAIANNGEAEGFISVGVTGAATEGIQILLSDDGITVDGEVISTKKDSAVSIGEDIIYYEEGKDELYGNGKKEDEHSIEEAEKHTVVTITKPGTYVVSGSISYGQIVVDLGEDADEDEEAVVNLVLNGVDINCDVASAILVLSAYECGDDSEENATPFVDTAAAGFNLILAKDSVNTIDGSYVAKIYKDGTTKEDIENDNAKKKYKFDGAIDSKISFNIDSEENGRLIVNAENEGISSSLHLTINGGNIEINACDDAINTNEDNVSVFTMNDGVLICDSGFGKEGDGIDSNGYITVNGGFITACANADSMDSGVDSDLGIFINGGTLFASGNMYDEVEKESGQNFMVLSFGEKITEEDFILVTNEDEQPLFAFSAVNAYTIAVYSSPELSEGTYHLYKVSSVTGDVNGSIYTNITDYTEAVQLQTNGSFMMGGPGMGERPEMPNGEIPAMAEGGERPQMPEDGERPQMPEDGERPQMPEDGEKPQMPEGENPAMAGGERPEMPEGEIPAMAGGERLEMQEDMREATTEFVFSKDSYQFGGIIEK